MTTQPAPGEPAMLSVYFVLQNYVVALKSNSGPGLYLVFIKNYTWVDGTQVPLVPPFLPWLIA